MNHTEKTISIAMQRKLLNALPPKGSNFRIELKGPRVVGKMLAMREFVERNRGSVVVTVQSKRGRDAVKQTCALCSRLGPIQMEAFPLSEGVAVQPAGLDHSVHDAGEDRLGLVVGERAHGAKSSGRGAA